MNNLTRNEINNLIGALQQLEELKSKKIQSKNHNAEVNGLEAFVRNQLFDHAGEFLGCWVAMNQEYDPLIRGFAGLLMRADRLLSPNKRTLNDNEQEAKQDQDQQEATPKNVVKINPEAK